MISRSGDERKFSVTVGSRERRKSGLQLQFSQRKEYSSSQSSNSFRSKRITVGIPITIIMLQSSCFTIVGLDCKLAKTTAKISRALREFYLKIF